MKIVIPMSGFGERFRRVGYAVPKPLIEVDGRPVITHVLDMFPGEREVLFICNREHLDEKSFRMGEILEKHCPTGQILAVEPHKLGPVHAVAQVFDLLDEDEPTIVNYCDFACYWDYGHFKAWVTEAQCDGCIPAYKGFHPHSLGTTNYAYMREANGWLLDIKEKEPFTDNRMNEYASSGTYYFAKGEYVKRFFTEAMARGLSVKNEYYVSLVYKLLLERQLRVAVYGLQHFLQWGTPEDMEEYQYWSRMFSELARPRAPRAAMPGTLLLPMVGAGSRFVRAEYDLPKPLIPVSGRPMFTQAAMDLPPMTEQVFVLRKDLPSVHEIQQAITELFPQGRVILLDGLTDGQARTCLLAQAQINQGRPLTIGACDCGVHYDEQRYLQLMRDNGTDVIVWVMRGHPDAKRFPAMYGWVEADRDLVRSVSVKVPLTNPANDPAIVGIFTFKRAGDFTAAARRLIERGAKVNGEYYVDSCINEAVASGLRCRILEVEQYFGWGTPEDLRTFEYWQSCFHKLDRHTYNLQADGKIPSEALPALARRYAKTVPPLPGPCPSPARFPV